MDVRDILVEAAGKSASDIFIISGAPLCYKANHMLTRMSEAPLSAEDTLQMAVQIYELAGMPRQENELPLREMHPGPFPDVWISRHPNVPVHEALL